VGYIPLKAILQKLNILENLRLVAEQVQPDADFPTVRFPNPEEDGALDLARFRADGDGITLVLANDPDADGFAVAEMVNGQWKQFTGDQIGVLFAHFLRQNCMPYNGSYWKSPDLATTATVFKRIRGLGNPYPVHVVERKVLRWRDLTLGYDSSTKDNVPELPSSASSQMITCRLDGGLRFTIRASGTEPKIKSLPYIPFPDSGTNGALLVYSEC